MKLISIIEAVHLSTEDLSELLNIDISTGLNQENVIDRRQQFGSNSYSIKNNLTTLKKFLSKFKEPMIVLLLLSCCVSLFAKEYENAISILVAILIVIVVGFYQEYSSDKVIESIVKLVPNRSICIRSSNISYIPSEELVPGDVIKLSIGDRVPADIRLISLTDFQIDESNLTGETKPVTKISHSLLEENFVINKCKNIAFAGTTVTSGNATGIVIRTGLSTEFGRIFTLMEHEDTPKSPLQLAMDSLGKNLSFYSLIFIGFITLVGILLHSKPLEMFTTGVSLAVAAIPEGLPIVVTITLAIKIIKMSKKQLVIKKLPIVETFGCMDTLCFDKTGTLTLNKSSVHSIIGMDGVLHEKTNIFDETNNIKPYFINQFSTKPLPLCALLCNNSKIDETGTPIGSAVDCCLYSFFNQFDVTNESSKWQRLMEVPFCSDRKWMSVVCKNSRNETVCQFVKGAPEFICKMSNKQNDYKQFMESCMRLSTFGLRVMALGYCTTNINNNYPQNLELLGGVALFDPIREGISKNLHHIRRNNVDLKMITGDAMETAIFIAQSTELVDEIKCISGSQLDKNINNINNIVNETNIFYRMTPQNKLSIIKALQANGRIVGMVGDGVNDSIALRASNIGIGITNDYSHDIAKEASDVIVLNNRLESLVDAIRSGRSIFYCIRNFVKFQLSTSIAIILLISVSVLMRFPCPMNAIQILWINIIMDGPPAQSLGMDELDDMPHLLENPRDQKLQVIDKQLFFSSAVSGLSIMIITITVFTNEMVNNQITSRDTTLAFTCFILCALFNAFCCRSQNRKFIGKWLFNNRIFVYSIGFSLMIQALVIYWHPLQTIFKTESISLADWMKLIVYSSIFLVVHFLSNILQNRIFKQQSYTAHPKQHFQLVIH